MRPTRNFSTILTGPLLACCLAVTAHAKPAGDAKQVDFQLKDYLGHKHALADYDDHQLVVLAFLGTECPLAKLYSERLQSLAEEYGPKGVAFFGVNSNVQDSITEIAAYARRHGVKFPILKDLGNEVADQLGATRTPEVFVLDAHRVIRYHGRIDDQYVVGLVRDKATREDLRAALDELLAGKSVTEPVTNPLGCIIGRVREVDETSSVTYSKQISRILNRRCVECHRDGEIAPFSLMSYDDVVGWGEMIAEVVEDRRMPPWHANPAHGTFANDRSLTDEEQELIFTWVKNGCPQGDTAELPARPSFTEGWQLTRQPDQVIAMRDEPFVVPANAGPRGVPYQRFRVPTGFTEDTWIESSEVQPGNRSVVHHIIVYVEPPGGRGRRNRIFLTAYVPGLRLSKLPAASAKLIPAGSTFLFENHYTPVGSVQEDISRLGLIFADPKDIQQEVITVEIVNPRFEIPPHVDNHVVTASSAPLREGVRLLSFSPHMHLRGKAFRYELVEEDGTREILLDVPGYDFNWQTRYILKQPRLLPKNSVIHCVAAFDNSADNLSNPDPTKTIRWGDQSWDEMMIGFFDVVVPRDASRRAGHKPIQTGLDVVGIFDDLDKNDDRSLSKEEARNHPLLALHFDRIDADNDGQLRLDEVLKVARSLGETDTAPAISALSAADRRLLKEFLRGYNRLLEFYTNIQMEVEYKDLSPLEYRPQGEDPLVRRLVYRANDELWRVDRTRSDTGKTTVYIATPALSIVAERESDDSPFVASQVHTSPYGYGYERIIASFKCCQAPVCPHQLMKEYITGEVSFLDVKRIDVAQDTVEGERIVTITVQGLTKRRSSSTSDGESGAPKTHVGRFVLYRDKSWALKEARTGPSVSTPDMITRCKYSGMKDRIPLLESVQYLRYGGENAADLWTEEYYEILSILPGSVPVKEFTPRAIGLKIGKQRAGCP